MTWQEQMNNELAAMDPIQRIRATGEWIAEMTQEILPRLGEQRREAILAALEADEEMDPYRLAEIVGGRGGTFARLAGEARTARKRRKAASGE